MAQCALVCSNVCVIYTMYFTCKQQSNSCNGRCMLYKKRLPAVDMNIKFCKPIINIFMFLSNNTHPQLIGLIAQYALMCSNVCEQCTLHANTNELHHNVIISAKNRITLIVGMTIQIPPSTTSVFLHIK